MTSKILDEELKNRVTSEITKEVLVNEIAESLARGELAKINKFMSKLEKQKQNEQLKPLVAAIETLLLQNALQINAYRKDLTNLSSQISDLTYEIEKLKINDEKLNGLKRQALEKLIEVLNEEQKQLVVNV